MWMTSLSGKGQRMGESGWGNCFQSSFLVFLYLGEREGEDHSRQPDHASTQGCGTATQYHCKMAKDDITLSSINVTKKIQNYLEKSIKTYLLFEYMNSTYSIVALKENMASVLLNDRYDFSYEILRYLMSCIISTSLLSLIAIILLN